MLSVKAPPSARLTPLCVDLDGTLIKTDLLLEGVLLLLRRNLLYLFLLPVWLARGKAFLKQQVFRRARPNVATLPYNRPLLEMLRKARAGGREVVLVTAADQSVALEIARHLNLFSAVLASDGQI